MPNNLTILLPVYNDYESANILIREIAMLFAGKGKTIHIVIVDDCSTDSISLDVQNVASAIASLKIIRLAKNVGHQTAIAVGLSYLNESREHDDSDIVVMDSDGEDRVEDIPILWEMASTQNKLVFASRKRRSEGMIFRLYYYIYRWLMVLFSGIHMNFGNFSCITSKLLPSVALLTDLPIHYAAAIVKAKMPIIRFSTYRGDRIVGKSKMNFVSLVLHGFRAFTVFAEQMGIRCIFGVTGVIIVLFFAIFRVLVLSLVHRVNVEGWTTVVLVLLFIMIINAVMIGFFTLLSIQIKTMYLQEIPFVKRYVQFIKEEIKVL